MRNQYPLKRAPRCCLSGDTVSDFPSLTPPPSLLHPIRRVAARARTLAQPEGWARRVAVRLSLLAMWCSHRGLLFHVGLENEGRAVLVGSGSFRSVTGSSPTAHGDQAAHANTWRSDPVGRRRKEAGFEGCAWDNGGNVAGGACEGSLEAAGLGCSPFSRRLL
jgi:hypothetical protein